MKKLARVLTLSAILLYAASVLAGIWEVDYHYYSDGTFTTQVGEDDFLCDDSETGWGSTSDFRVRDRYSCNDGSHVGHACMVWTDTQWTFVTCPPGV